MSEAVAVARVTDGLAAARQTVDSTYRSVVNPHIGPGLPFQSMEEFEALRFMRGADLRPDQVAAINQIRLNIGLPLLNEPVVKVFKESKAIEKLISGDPKLATFFARKADVDGATTTEQLIDRLRLDYENGFDVGDGYAMLETVADDTIRNGARFPRQGDFNTGGPLDFAVSDPYPLVGNALIASRDGRLVPEFHTGVPGIQHALQPNMPVGTVESPLTVMRFRNSDGTAKVINGPGGQQASEWKLVQLGPDDYEWRPL